MAAKINESFKPDILNIYSKQTCLDNLTAEITFIKLLSLIKQNNACHKPVF